MLNHTGTQTIKTERLTLRRFTPDDAQAMFDNWCNDEDVCRYLTWEPHGDVANTKQLLDSWCAAYEEPNYYNWLIEFDGVPIGSTAIVLVNDKHEYACIGYCIGKEWWGRGIMTEAARAVIDYMFCRVGVNRIEISHATKNPASGRVAQKCGLHYEGTKREYFKAKSGEFFDIAFYSILKNEHTAAK